MKISTIGKENTQNKENHKPKNQNAKLLVNHLELLIESHNRHIEEREEIDEQIKKTIRNSRL